MSRRHRADRGPVARGCLLLVAGLVLACITLGVLAVAGTTPPPATAPSPPAATTAFPSVGPTSPRATTTRRAPARTTTTTTAPATTTTASSARGSRAPVADRCTNRIDYTGDPRDNATINSIGDRTGNCPPPLRSSTP